MKNKKFCDCRSYGESSTCPKHGHPAPDQDIKKVDPFQSGNEPLTDKEMKRYEKTKGVLFTEYTPKQHRQAQDLAVQLGHLNKGIPSLIDLYAAAPELLEALQRCRDLLLDSVNFNEGDKATTEAVSIADVVIAKAEGK